MQSWRENASWRGAAPFFSVILLGHRNGAWLRRAVNSLLAFCPHDAEILLVVNGGDTQVLAAAETLQAEAASAGVALSWVVQPELRPGAARAAGVARARGAVLLFLDDDVICFQDLFAPAREIFLDPAVVAAGGPNLTPPVSTAWQKAGGWMLESFLGAAAMRARYAPLAARRPASEHDLILCNLFVRRSAFSRSGFPAVFVSNEENYLLQSLEAEGGQLVADPGLAVYHERRPGLEGVFRQGMKYGQGRAQNLLLRPETFHPFYFAPACLLLTLLFLPWAWPLFAIYAGLVAASTAAIFFRQRDSAALLLPLLYGAMHLGYGIGFFTAFFRWFGRKHELAKMAP